MNARFYGTSHQMRVDYATSHTIARIIQTYQQNPPTIGTKTHIAPTKIKDKRIRIIRINAAPINQTILT
jgi:hypothetical protein